MIRAIIGDMEKPAFQTCFLIPIIRNSQEKWKEYHYNECSRNLEILNMEIAEKFRICK